MYVKSKKFLHNETLTQRNATKRNLTQRNSMIQNMIKIYSKV